MVNRPIFYIDPQSSGNLAAYDHGVLSNVKQSVYYICSRYYDYHSMPSHVRCFPIFSYNRLGNPTLKLMSYLLSMLRLAWMIVRYKPSLLHVQWFRVPYLDYGFYWIVKHIIKVPLLYTAHNVLPHNTGKRHQQVFQKTYLMFDNIIVHAPKTKKEIQESFAIEEAKIHVIYHGVLTIPFNEQKLRKETPELNKEYNFDGCMVLTSLGEQSAYKGIDIVSKIWKETSELNQNSNIKLVIAGRIVGIDLSHISSYNNVIIKDKRISNEEYIYILRHTDVYLLPYRKISQSGALFTAMAEHIPMLVSDAGGLAEPLKIGKIGWKVKSDDTESLKHMLLYLINHHKEVKAIKEDESIWEKVCEVYSWDNISNQTDALYENIIKSSKR